LLSIASWVSWNECLTGTARPNYADTSFSKISP
jgi:hypothetical protein